MILLPEAGMLADTFSRDHTPVATVSPGDTFTVRTLDASGHLQPQTFPGEETPLALPARRGHALVGPIAVEGARAGQVLAVTLHSLRPDRWGFTASGGRDTPLNRRLGVAHGETAWLLWDVDTETGSGVNQHGTRVPLAPFLGITGVAPAEPGEHSTIPPRTVGGGNIDCRELVAGSTLFLPVAVDGALLYLGDGHAAQGDGEVGGTAIEVGMTTELSVALLEATDVPVPTIHATTPAGRVTFGFDADLNAATGDALAAMLTWLEALLGVERATALAIASSTVDMRVTQIANQTWGVHALLPDGALATDR